MLLCTFVLLGETIKSIVVQKQVVRVEFSSSKERVNKATVSIYLKT